MNHTEIERKQAQWKRANTANVQAATAAKQQRLRRSPIRDEQSSLRSFVWTLIKFISSLDLCEISPQQQYLASVPHAQKPACPSLTVHNAGSQKRRQLTMKEGNQITNFYKMEGEEWAILKHFCAQNII